MNTEKTTAVLLCNLGTPDAPTPAALRRYLAQFLSDPRVVEIPRLFWLPLLHGVILRVRPSRSAAKYASMWSDAGSPLAVWTQRQADLLGQRLRESGLPAPVLPAMRYGQPSVANALERLKQQNCTRILLLPLYPQYAGSTSATALDAAYAWLQQSRNQPEIRAVRNFHDHPG